MYVAKLGDIDKILACSPGLAYRFNYYAANCMFSTLQFVAVCQPFHLFTHPQKKTKPKQTNEVSKFNKNQSESQDSEEKKKKEGIEKRMQKKKGEEGKADEASYISTWTPGSASYFAVLKVKETTGKKIPGFLLLYPSSIGFSPEDSSSHFAGKRV